MKGKRASRQEKNFLAVSLAASVLILALAFLDTAPLWPVGENASTQAASTLLDAARVDLNTADLEALCTLPGIGESLAGRIIAYREANGPFRTIEQIMEVSGIGEAKFAELKDRITVDNEGDMTNEDSGGR